MSVYWKAVYADGTELLQCNEDGSVNKYPDINRSKLKAFELYKDGRLLFRMQLGKKKKLIYRRRVAKRLTGGAEAVVYIVGWHKKVKGKSLKKIAFVYEDGHVEFKEDWEESSKWHYAPNLINCEKE